MTKSSQTVRRQNQCLIIGHSMKFNFKFQLTFLLSCNIYDFHRKYVLVPAEKAANNVVVVWRLHYINTLIQELGSTKTYERTSTDRRRFTDYVCAWTCICENLHHPSAYVGHEDCLNSPLHNKRAWGSAECIKMLLVAVFAIISILKWNENATVKIWKFQ